MYSEHHFLELIVCFLLGGIDIVLPPSELAIGAIAMETSPVIN